jgi:serine protease
LKPEIVKAVEEATQVVDSSLSLPRARFALLVRPADDPNAKAAEVRAALAPFKPVVRPLSPKDQFVLVAELPDRIFGFENARVFEAAHLLRDRLGFEEAEPDLPTNYFPEAGQIGTAGAPAVESTERLCFTDQQPELAARPRWALESMRVEEAWAFSARSGKPDRGLGIVIAQPDTGVTNHSELADVVRVAPRDVLDGDADPTDPLDDIGNPGHGTGTASVAVSRESNLISGSAPLAHHMPIRAIRSVVRITQVSIAEAIDWAATHGAHVITMSLGGLPSFSLHRALRRAVAADVIVLSAAGNCVRTVVWPARYDDCIAVAGVDSADIPWKGSCRGSAVDVSAPGQNVFRAQASAQTNTAVAQGQGTSFAVALTAGVAALWLAHHGRDNLVIAARSRGETLQTMFRRLVRATSRRPVGWNSFNMGAGIVDARALLGADLDLGRGLESVAQPDSADAREIIALQSFVLETVGEQGINVSMDWKRFGPEIAAALLARQLALRDPLLEAADLPGVPLSPQLANAAAGAPLLTALNGAYQ